ncbi:MAG: DUF1820 domain-containing protein [Desulfuromonas sp.]|nr:MAG: DUF1820 domain-containing protein [Desulfuromonas sp.]
MSKQKRHYRIFFTCEGKNYEIYARKVEQSDMYGFVTVEDVVFGERSNIVVDPSEESLKNEFSGVKRFMIPHHSISRIDEVEKSGAGKVVQLKGNGSVTAPAPGFPPRGGKG